MLSWLSVVGLLGLLTACASATSLTFKLNAHDHECFYAHIENVGAKIGFYFAVQAGGSFEIDYKVTGPATGRPDNSRVILEGETERQGDFAFTAVEKGEYRFCFDNTKSTFTEKTIDFDITVENEIRPALPQKAGASHEQLTIVEEAVFKLSSQVATLARQQKYFRTRENRNFSTVRSTEKRIWNFSLLESGLIITMAGLQVFVVKMFFTGGRKGYV